MNKRLVVIRNVANLYAKADTSSEVVSQTVLGEAVYAEKKEGEFYFVQTGDFYSGWLRESAAIECSADITGYNYRTTTMLFGEVYREANAAEELITRLPIGSRVVVLPERVEAYSHIMLPDLTDGWIMTWGLTGSLDAAKNRLSRWSDTSSRAASIAVIGEEAVAIGKRWIGTPYLWGGKTPFGVDCSGFTQACYRRAGIHLLRDARLQINDPRFTAVDEGKTLFDAPALQDGDLLFFGPSKDRVTHVAISAEGRYMHSAGGLGVVWQHLDDLACAKQYLGARRLSASTDSLALKKPA